MSKINNEIIIKSITKKNNRYLVETNENEYQFSEDTIIQYLIFKDKVFSKPEFDEVLNAEKVISLFSKAIHFLSFQSRSIKEIEDYLKSKGASQVEVATIVDKLKNLGYINDERLALEIMDYCTRTQKGPNILKSKLEIKNIDEELISKTTLLYSKELQDKIIKEVVDGSFDKLRSFPVNKQKEKLYQKLIRDGFTSSIITDILNHTEFTSESLDNLKQLYQKLLNKYQDMPDHEKHNKIIHYLMNKGFQYQEIMNVISKE